MISYLVYVSQAATELNEEALEAILAESRAYNSRNDVTGVLLFVAGRDGNHGSFMQLLEGDQEKIDNLRRRIFADPRHHTKIVLEKGTKPSRDFSDWSMAFKSVAPSDLASHTQFADLAATEFIERCQASGAPGALKFLCDFWNAEPS
ncbi:BLUF domain-containing protein [Hoeflea sp.]|uniref:BLUF domain-containing protein n=1 Tax=Hoeflea sp. TaxID=1940281 RepID=UPI003A92C8B2